LPRIFATSDTDLYVHHPVNGVPNSAYRIGKGSVSAQPSLIIGEVERAWFHGIIRGDLYYYVMNGGNGFDEDFFRCSLSACTKPVTLFHSGSASIAFFGDSVPSDYPTYEYVSDGGGMFRYIFTWWYDGAAADTFDIPITSLAFSYPAFKPFASRLAVFWIDRDGSGMALFTANRATKMKFRLAASPMIDTSLEIVDANDRSVLLYSYLASALYRVPLPLGLDPAPLQPLTIVTGAPFFPLGAREDGTSVYWLDGEGSLLSCSPGNCASTTTIMASGQEAALTLHEDAAALYWARENPNSIMRLAK
jgi:hypothetical protein